MPTDRKLIEIVTAANMTGADQAKAGMLSLNASTLALGASLGLLVVAGKSAIEITEAHQKAELKLAQAVGVSGGNLDAANKYLRSFIDSNRAYITDQSLVISSYSDLLRSGLSATEAQLDMNRAVDLAALKNISLNDATQLLIAAEHGRLRGLIDLGISTTKYTDAQGNLVAGSHNVEKAFSEMDARIKGGRDSLTDSEQAYNRLSNDWQDLANTAGPPLLQLLDDILKRADDAYKKLQAMGGTDYSGNWGNLQNSLITAGKWIKTYVLDPLDRVTKWLQGGRPDPNAGPGGFLGTDTGGSDRLPRGAAAQPHGFGAAGGFEGMVSKPTWFLTGEGKQSEYVSITPAGGGRSGGGVVHVHMEGIYAGDGPSLDILANKIALRLGYATGR